METILKIDKNDYVYNETLDKYFDKDSNLVRPEIIINEILGYVRLSWLFYELKQVCMIQQYFVLYM